MHILLSVTDKCPTWISGRERMAVEIISWQISLKECCRTRGSNPRACQADVHLLSTTPSRFKSGTQNYRKPYYLKLKNQCNKWIGCIDSGVTEISFLVLPMITSSDGTSLFRARVKYVLVYQVYRIFSLILKYNNMKCTTLDGSYSRPHAFYTQRLVTQHLFFLCDFCSLLEVFSNIS